MIVTNVGPCGRLAGFVLNRGESLAAPDVRKSAASNPVIAIGMGPGKHRAALPSRESHELESAPDLDASYRTDCRARVPFAGWLPCALRGARQRGCGRNLIDDWLDSPCAGDGLNRPALADEPG